MPSLGRKFLVADTRPIPAKIKFWAVFFDVALPAGRVGLLCEPPLRVLGMLQARPVAHFALHVFEFWRIDFADKPARFPEAGSVADQALRIERFVHLLERRVSPAVTRLRPDGMFLRVTGQAGLVRRVYPILFLPALGSQGGHKQFFHFRVVRVV